MEKRSKHYGDVAKWLEKVIDSCETYQQTMTARKLVQNYFVKYFESVGVATMCRETSELLQ